MGQGVAAYLPEDVGGNLTLGSSFQDFRCNVSTCSNLAARDAFADFIEDRAQKRGGFRVEHEMPPTNPILARFHPVGDSSMLSFAANALGILRSRALPADASTQSAPTAAHRLPRARGGGPNRLVASVRSLNRTDVGLPGANGPSSKMRATPVSDLYATFDDWKNDPDLFDRRDGADPRDDSVEILLSHLAEIALPGHRQLEHAAVAADALGQRALELGVRPRAHTLLFVGGDVGDYN